MWINPAGSLTGDLHTMHVKGVIWSIHRDCFLDFLSNSTKLFAIGKWDKVLNKTHPSLVDHFYNPTFERFFIPLSEILRLSLIV